MVYPLPYFSVTFQADGATLHIAIAEENIGMNLDDSASTSQLNLELDFDSFDDGDLGIRVPEPAYHPRGRL